MRVVTHEWLVRVRSRREIANLDDATMIEIAADLGMSRSQMLFEAKKPFWKK